MFKEEHYTIRIKISNQPYLYIPESLCEQLGLADEDQVEVARSGELITLRKPRRGPSSKLLRELAGVIKTSRPIASVDVNKYMTQRGYEYLEGESDSHTE